MESPRSFASPPITNADRRPSSRQRSSTSRRWLRSRNMGREVRVVLVPSPASPRTARSWPRSHVVGDAATVVAAPGSASARSSTSRSGISSSNGRSTSRGARRAVRPRGPARRASEPTSHDASCPNAPVPVAVDDRPTVRPGTGTDRRGVSRPCVSPSMPRRSSRPRSSRSAASATPRGTPTTTSPRSSTCSPPRCPEPARSRSRATTARSTSSRCRAATTERVTSIRGPQFDPDGHGRLLVFRDSRAGVNVNDDIAVIRVDGTGFRNLTRTRDANDGDRSGRPTAAGSRTPPTRTASPDLRDGRGRVEPDADLGHLGRVPGLVAGRIRSRSSR